MPRLPLGTLPAFRSAARLANLRAAAEELHLTPSAVSQQIKQLEDQVGFALFERRGRRIVLNAAGQALREAVDAALDRLDDGLRSATAVAQPGTETELRITMLPSFAQRWLLPRMAKWRAREPSIRLDVHTSQHLVDLQREGFHAALRQGSGAWPGLTATLLLDSPFVAVGAPAVAERLRQRPTAALCEEPLLGEAALWQRWFALDGCRVEVRPVASFNDSGLMLQAAEQGLGITLAREMLAADALREGRLVRLSPLALSDASAYALWFACPTALAGWPPLVALRDWLIEELAASQRGLPGAG